MRILEWDGSARLYLSSYEEGCDSCVCLAGCAVMSGFAVFAYAQNHAAKTGSPLLLVANQHDHNLSLIDPAAGKQVATVPVDGVTGHEVAASPDGKTAYVPIYGDSGVGRPGTDGSKLSVIDLAQPQGRAHDRFWPWSASALRDLRPQQRHAVCDDGAGQDGEHHRSEDPEDRRHHSDRAGAVAHAGAVAGWVAGVYGECWARERCRCWT